MRLCSYVVKNDYGFAPNPFFGYCTLAACTPNHAGIRLSSGDWLMGHAAAKRGQGLIYAMEVFEAPGFDAYYNDQRFECKKPRFDRTWKEACGDNIYHRDCDGKWVQDRSPFHGPDNLDQDTQYPAVFVSKHFYYFGENAPAVPREFASLIWGRCGCKCSHVGETAEGFVAWLRATFSPGVLGNPRDLERGQALSRTLFSGSGHFALPPVCSSASPDRRTTSCSRPDPAPLVVGDPSPVRVARRC
jgi:hypothetical protein